MLGSPHAEDPILPPTHFEAAKLVNEFVQVLGTELTAPSTANPFHEVANCSSPGHYRVELNGFKIVRRPFRSGPANGPACQRSVSLFRSRYRYTVSSYSMETSIEVSPV